MRKIEETPFNTQFDGKIAELREKSVSIQVLNDGECFLVVPKHRIPVVSQIEGALVKVFLTTKYGHFGIISNE